MKLVFVNSIWPASWGGGEKWTVAAAEWFRAGGSETCVVGRPYSRLIAAAREKNLRAIETGFGGDYDPLAMLRAGKILRQLRPDLVVVNFNKEAWQFGAAAKILGIPVVARHGFPLFRKTWRHHFLKRTFITSLVVNAASIRNYYASLGMKVDDVTVIHNGTPMIEQQRRTLRARFGISKNQLLIMAAGRLESQKRLDRVIEIVAALRSRGMDAQCLIAGDGALHDELQARIHAMNLSAHIRLVGFLPELASEVGDADLFLLTSDEEGTPNVLLEAMAAQVACVSAAVGSAPEILSGELSDYCIKANDVAAMTDRAAQLLEHPDLLAHVRQAMFERVRDHFSFDHSLRRFDDLFRNILDRKPPPRL